MSKYVINNDSVDYENNVFPVHPSKREAIKNRITPIYPNVMQSLLQSSYGRSKTFDLSTEIGFPSSLKNKTDQAVFSTKPTSFTAETGDMNARQIKYFNSLEEWESFTDKNPYLSRQAASDRRSAQATMRFKNGGASKKYAVGGESEFFSQMADRMLQQQYSEPTEALPIEDTVQADEDYDISDSPEYSELLEKYNTLEAEHSELLSAQEALPAPETGDPFLDYLFSGSKNAPIDFDNISFDTEEGSFKDKIAVRESGGKYTAQSPNSSAVGKYQFLWNTWGEDIKKRTGVRSKEEFKGNPMAQEEFFSYYDKTTLTPQANKYINKVKKYIPNVDIEDVKTMLHFAGAGNLEKAIKTGNFNKPLDANGTSILSYLKH